MSQLRVGTRAPEFELKDANARIYRLSEALARGPVALAFYKSACPTCQFTLPYLQKIFSQLGKNAGPAVWGISEDDADETREFTKRHGITFPVLIDEYPYPVSDAYGLQFVPAIFLIQTDGTIVGSDYGFTKQGLNRIAGFEFFADNDRLPATRPG